MVVVGVEEEEDFKVLADGDGLKINHNLNSN